MTVADPSEPPIAFVHLGERVPDFAASSLRFAAKGHSGAVVLLTNSSQNLPPRGEFEVVRISEWYDASHFEQFRRETTLDPTFRGGFWLHVVERFFVLRQFMDHSSLDALFHAELDVLVFDLSDVARACDSHGSGIFAVMDDPSRALASLFYCNSKADFDHFLRFALSQPTMRNEMEMIGEYLQSHPSRGHALPSDRFFDPDAHPLSPSGVPDQIGLFDANALGQWVFGLDPRNVKYRVTNHYWNEMAKFPIDRLRFRMGLHGRRLWARLPGGPERQIRTLHIHSKVVGRLTARPILLFYLWASRLPFSLTLKVKKGSTASRLLALLLKRPGSLVARRLSRFFPGGFRFVLRWLATHGVVPLSVRQRAEFVRQWPISKKYARAERVVRGVGVLSVSPDGALPGWLSKGLDRLNLEWDELGTSDNRHHAGTLSRDSDGPLFLRELLKSDYDRLLVTTGGEEVVEVGRLLDVPAFNPLAVLPDKPHPWTEELVFRLVGARPLFEMNPVLQVIRPALVREMHASMQASQDVLEDLLDRQDSWPLFLSLYSSWLLRRYPKKIRFLF